MWPMCPVFHVTLGVVFKLFNLLTHVFSLVDHVRSRLISFRLDWDAHGGHI